MPEPAPEQPDRKPSKRPRFMDWREEVAADKKRRAEAGRQRELARMRRHHGGRGGAAVLDHHRAERLICSPEWSA
ncbi:hypothetical protein SAMN05421505_12074 [Sinosporangium album]|uniref:Uncharacterized protein n=1 Tax=Sinosporangium album TaxID=504805 RepID=A0A1G8EF48_9ACTN|nr:hypothetical protein [Sinosporangium album]SDH68552.1 hypothetical protein SAMN05421505_12074 [Sinosporangium album]